MPPECPYVKPINRGQKAECDGFYFSDDAERAASNAKKDVEVLKKINDELEKKSAAQAKETEILERRLNLYVTQSEILSKKEAQRDNMESLYRIGYFALGALLTGVIASNVNR